MRRVLLVAPDFPPRNVAGALRLRLLASGLGEFGWQPIVLTVKPEAYEGALDGTSELLLPAGVRVERVGAWPPGWCRRIGLGEIAVRAQWAMRARAGELGRQGEVNMVLASVLPGYSALVGAWTKRRWGIPFVLDYQDPWVPLIRSPRRLGSKAWWAEWLARRLEPGAVRQADALTAVSAQTLDSLRQRALLPAAKPVEIVPIGAEARDHEIARDHGQAWLSAPPGEVAFAYVGTLTEKMLPAARTAMRAIGALAESQPGRRFTLHFVGTSAQVDGVDRHGLRQMAAHLGVERLVHVLPRRVPYLDALRTMQTAQVLLLLGSTDPHYTASKIFPCWLAGKPICGLFHSASTIHSLARELGGAGVVGYDERDGPETKTAELAELFKAVAGQGLAALPPRQIANFEPYSAASVARRYAGLFDRLTSSPAG